MPLIKTSKVCLHMEADAYILKDTSKPEDTDAVYEIVEDDDELEYVSRIFAEILDDIDIEK